MSVRSEENRPIVVIPMGDPAGIGPEIIIKALAKPETAEAARCIVIGDRKVLQQAANFPQMPEIEICSIASSQKGKISPENLSGNFPFENFVPGKLNLIDLHNVDMETFRAGEIALLCGRAAYEYIKAGTELCMKGIAQKANTRRTAEGKTADPDIAAALPAIAMATPPIHKEALRAGGIDFIGHTEILGALTGTKDPLTMFEVRGMRVFFLTRHMSLRKACNAVTKEAIVDCVHRCMEALKRLGITGGTMAIAGLNPHSGEHGLFGDEEERFIRPAVEELQKEGYSVEGPIGADSVFHLALTGRYHSVLSLYHDQGHIATKTLDFERTIAVTNGLPFLRTSVDHGTAMDIAGKGIAGSVSMEEAIRLAAKYAPSFCQK
mgnify:FL=1